MTDIQAKTITSYLSNLPNPQKTQENTQRRADDVITDNQGLLGLLQQVQGAHTKASHQKKIEGIAQQIQSGSYEVNVSELSRQLFIEHMMKEDE